MPNKIYMRADGGIKIGLGHLIRCSALAHMLSEDFKISFVCSEIPDSIEADFNRAGFEVIRINEEEEFISLLRGSEIVVLDHYGLGSDYQVKVKERGSILVCIDDFHNGTFVADLIINHAPGLTPKEYKAEPYTQFSLGLGYALLRPVFIEAAKKERLPGEVENVFVCFGGADPKNLTCQALQAVSNSGRFKNIYVVTGQAYIYAEALKEIVGNDPSINHFSGISEDKICDIMMKADLAIVPSSSVLIEAVACGVNSITCYYVDNQKEFHDRIVSMGMSSVGRVDKLYSMKLEKALQEFIPVETLTVARNQIRESKKNHLVKFKALDYGKL